MDNRSAELHDSKILQHKSLFKVHKGSHLIRRAPDFLVNFCHWQVQADDFVVYQKLRGKKPGIKQSPGKGPAWWSLAPKYGIVEI